MALEALVRAPAMDFADGFGADFLAGLAAAFSEVDFAGHFVAVEFRFVVIAG